MQTLKKRSLYCLFIGLFLALIPAISFADKLNYNYIKGSLCFYPSFGNQDLIGVEFQGSHLITPEIFAFGGLQYLTDDIDLTALHVGVAYRYGLNEATDVYGGLTVEYQDWDMTVGHGNVGVDDTAIGLRGGIRHLFTPDLEFGGQLRIITGDLDYVGVRGTARYFLNKDISLIAEVDIYDDELGLLGGISYNF